MARSEARLSVDIWTDPDFRALTPRAQRMYFFLLSQPDVAHDGTLALRERRWASSAYGLGADEVHADLAELNQARFIVIDEDTEEVLIRSFIRRDGVYRQPNLVRAAKKHLPLVASRRIRAVLLGELVRIRVLPDADKTVKFLDEMIAEIREDTPPAPREAQAEPVADPKANPSRTLRVAVDEPQAEPTSMPLGDRGVVTAVTTECPYPLDPFPLPLPPPAGNSLALAAAPDLATVTAQPLIGEWLEHCRKRPPQNVIGQVSKQVKALLTEGIDPADVRAGLAAWHQKGVHPSVLPSLVNELMNAAPARARASPRASTTDSRVSAALTLADQFERGEIA